MTRTGRQNLIQGWNQDAVDNARVLLVGSSTLGQMIAGALAGLGIGNIYLVDNSRMNGTDNNFLCKYKGDNNVKRVKEVKETLDVIASDISKGTKARFSRFAEFYAYQFKPQIVIDATNDPSSKEGVLDYTSRYHIPFVSVSSDNDRSAVACYWPKNHGKFNLAPETPDLDSLLHAEFAGAVQGGFPSSIAAGVAVEEVRKFLFQYNDTDNNLPRNKRFVYNNRASNRIEMKSNLKKRRATHEYNTKKALVVGAGALGNFVTLNLAFMGIQRLDIIDMDIIKLHNLNRQLLLYGRDGEYKCHVLAERIKEISPYMDVRPILGKVGSVSNSDTPWLKRLHEKEFEQWQLKPEDKREEFPTFEKFVRQHYELTHDEQSNNFELLNQSNLQDYDIIFGCLDNKHARMWLNNAAIAYHIPYIDGGTGPTSGQMAVYVPGVTPCVDCQIKMINMPPHRNSCIEGPEGSVVMSNMVVGGLMVGETGHVFDNGLNYNPFTRDLRYNVEGEYRVYFRPGRNRTTDCNC